MFAGYALKGGYVSNNVRIMTIALQERRKWLAAQYKFISEISVKFRF